MKKWTILLASLLMACVSQAAVVNGDFSGSLTNNGSTFMAYQESDVNAGWIQSSVAITGVPRTEWGIVAGKLTRNYAVSANAGYCVGQIFDDTLTNGNYSLQFDYDLINSDTDGSVVVQLYLYDSLTGAGLVYSDRADLTNAGGTTPTDTAAWDKTLLVTNNLMSAANGSYTGKKLNFTLASDMGEKDRLAIRIYSLSLGSATGTLTFDNFSIVAEGSAPSNDDDSDGLPNDWETLYFGGATNAVATATAANGINTLLETYIAGINPTNPAAAFLLDDIDPLQWTAVSGRVYSVYWTSNLLDSFQSLETNISWSQNIWTDTVHGAENPGFYKIQVELAP